MSCPTRAIHEPPAGTRSATSTRNLVQLPQGFRISQKETGASGLTRSFRFLVPAFLMCAAFAAPAMAQTTPTVANLNVLTPSDEDGYKTAFTNARASQKEALDAALGRVSDGTLRPHVERVRLLSPQSPPDLPAMSAWLARWGDVAGASDVYARASEAQEQEQSAARLMGVVATPAHLKRPDPIPVRRSMGAMREPNFNPVPIGFGATRADRARIDTLAARFYDGDDETAFGLASQEIDGPQSGQAGWIGGLAAFRMGDFASAQRYFTTAANWSAGDDWTRSAGAFWAARSAEKLGNQAASRTLLEQAASNPLTFYGQLSLAKLGRWDTMRVPSVQDEQERAARLLRADPGVRRAAALVEVGRKDDAEAELSAAWGRGRADDDLGYLAIARALNLDDVVSRMSQTSTAASMASLYPAPANIRPSGGEFVLDRAVVLAVIRQESKFENTAVSYAGARGLMQLMPRTAAWMTGRRDLASNPRLLQDNTLNVTLGEAYLEKMMAEGPISNCLIRTFMAYNAGPGSVGRWAVSVKGGEDPLMFMEGAPSGQARVYAERVMSNLWIYHRRFGQRAPSLEKLARGFTPTYEPQDNPRRNVASSAGTAAGIVPIGLR
jgi:soluble lytic murein transglycosylase